MLSKFIRALKLVIPLGIGLFLIWLFYDALCPRQKEELFEAFRKANYSWVILSLLFGWMSHASRAIRSQYLLKPLGYTPRFWSCYHAVMIGYLVNLVFPRAGELSRAGALSKTEKIPFQKGFGAIIAERAVDLIMLGILVLVAMATQWNRLDSLRVKMDGFKAGGSACGNTVVFSVLGQLVTYGLLAAGCLVVILVFVKPSFRGAIRSFLKGLAEGILSIVKIDRKGPFILHTCFIWSMYLSMFGICFFALEATHQLGVDAMLVGFIAGAVGIVLVQGGIGVYPALVGLALTTYLAPSEVGISPYALALGWITWTSQTLMLIVLGFVSVIANGKRIQLRSK